MKIYNDEPYYLEKINKNAKYNQDNNRFVSVDQLDNSKKVQKLSTKHQHVNKSVVNFVHDPISYEKSNYEASRQT